MKSRFTLILVLAILISACSAPGDIEIHSAWARPTVQGENAALYFTLHNHSANHDELIGASSNVADVIEIHESKMENEVAQMEMLTALPFDEDEEIVFAPGGLHIMLVDINQDLNLGDHIGLILHFKSHEDIVVNVHIEETMPDEDHDH